MATANRHRANRDGFTLVEVLVALAIISIALLAALRTAGGGTASLEELRARMLAGWVAENVLTVQRARGDWPQPGLSEGTQRQAGIDFHWRQEVSATPNAAFRRVDIRVAAAAGDARPLAELTGYVVRPAGAGR